MNIQMVTVLYARSEPTTMRQEPLHVSMHRLLIMVLILCTAVYTDTRWQKSQRDWMDANWAFVNQHAETEPWFGQMALPRELSIVDGKLIQRPTKEFDACRKNPVSHNGVCVSGLEAVKLEGIEGRVADVELTITQKARTTVTICLK